MQDKRYSQLFDLAAALSEISDYQETLHIVTNYASRIFDAEEASIIMINPRTDNTIKTIYSDIETDNKTNIKLLHDLVTGWVLKNKKIFCTADPGIELNLITTICKEADGGSIVAGPIKSSGKIVGVIFLMGNNKYSKDDIELLENLLSVAAPFLFNAQTISNYFSPSLSNDSLVMKYRELGLVGSCPKFVDVLKSIETASRCSIRVMIEGGSGTGKELVAKAIHKMSDRADKKFVAIDCGAIPSHLIESELFGHVKGAFTGADTNRKGLFQEANGGTLFMDEISNLPLDTQSKLLRVLQENEIRPLGSNETKKIDVRIITASSLSLSGLIEKKLFREDLFYRLFVYPIDIPSLQQRKEDIQQLAEHFLSRFSKQQNKSISGFSDDAMSALINHKWKGNVRELENTIERVVALADDGTDEIDVNKLPAELTIKNIESSETNTGLSNMMETYETGLIRDALTKAGWNQSEAARQLGIPEQTLRYKMKKLNINKSISDIS